MDFLIECLAEIFIEIIFHGLLWCYRRISYPLIPQRVYATVDKSKITTAITVVFAIFLLSVIFGLPLAFIDFGDGAVVNTVGKYMFLIPMSIVGAQTLLTLAVVTVKRLQKKR